MFALKKIITAAALTFAAMSAQAVPTLTFSTPTVTVGSSVDIDVTVTDIADLMAYQVSVNYDPTLLSFGTITSGAFLGTAGVTDFFVADTTTPGVLSYILDGLYGTGPGATGSGTLFTLHFDTLAAGTALFSFSDLIFLNSSLNDIAIDVAGGSLAILPVVVTPPTGDVPEPATLLLLGVGGAAFMMRRNGAKAIQQAA